MQFSPQSQVILDQLQAGLIVMSGAVTIGPLDKAAKRLLDIFAVHYDQIYGVSGEQQAKLLLRFYAKAVETTAEAIGDTAIGGFQSASASPQAQSAVPSAKVAKTETETNAARWLLESLECQSVRGIAPFGAHWEFQLRWQELPCLWSEW